MQRPIFFVVVAAAIGLLAGDARSGARRSDAGPEQVICRSSAAQAR